MHMKPRAEGRAKKISAEGRAKIRAEGRAKISADRRASITAELALTSVFVLLPLLAGGADFLELISAKSQLDATLQSLDTFAWNNPASAANTGQLGGVLAQLNQRSLPQITFPDGKADATSSYQPAVTYQCSVPPSAVQTAQAAPCPASQTQQTFVTYQIMTKVSLVIPLPFGLASPYALTDSGQIEIQ